MHACLPAQMGHDVPEATLSFTTDCQMWSWPQLPLVQSQWGLVAGATGDILRRAVAIEGRVPLGRHGRRALNQTGQRLCTAGDDVRLRVWAAAMAYQMWSSQVQRAVAWQALVESEAQNLEDSEDAQAHA